VDTLTIKLQFGRYAWVVEADITKFFDTIDHDWMVRMLAERIDDGALLRLMQKWLKAGVLDTDGQVLHPVTGPRQGARSHQSWPMCFCTTCGTSGLKQWSSSTVEGKRA
jgi:retron-type reverse transcriptase